MLYPFRSKINYFNKKLAINKQLCNTIPLLNDAKWEPVSLFSLFHHKAKQANKYHIYLIEK